MNEHSTNIVRQKLQGIKNDNPFGIQIDIYEFKKLFPELDDEELDNILSFLEQKRMITVLNRTVWQGVSMIKNSRFLNIMFTIFP